MSINQDNLYASPIASVSSFKFDDSVVNVFPDMIQRSVPGYPAIVSAIGLLAGRYAQEHSVCYDLGCSLGAATLSMRHQISTKHCKIIAVDNSKSMVQQFKQNLMLDTGDIEKSICSRTKFYLTVYSHRRQIGIFEKNLSGFITWWYFDFVRKATI